MKTNESEVENIKKAINCYIDGAITRDYKMIYQGWHPDAKMLGLNPDNTLRIFDRSFWQESFENSEKDPNVSRVSEILSIDFHGAAANAKVKTVVESPKQIVIFIDYLNLMKIEDKWQIANKIFDKEIIPKS
ncbi:MAG: nuclear transport factor 2 family protein [Candidatus Thorarchaeota archaeon]